MRVDVVSEETKGRGSEADGRISSTGLSATSGHWGFSAALLLAVASAGCSDTVSGPDEAAPQIPVSVEILGGPEDGTLWTGDTLRLDVRAVTTSGETVPDAAIVFRLEPDETADVSTDGLVRVKRYGEFSVIASLPKPSGVLSDTLGLVALPQIQGQLVPGVRVPPPGEDWRSWQVLLEGPGISEAFAVESDGTFTGRLTELPSAPFGVRVTPREGVVSEYFPTILDVHDPARLPVDLPVVVVPRSYTIPSGRYAGTVVDLPMGDVYAGMIERRDSPFLSGTRLIRDEQGFRIGSRPNARTWPESAFPIPLGFSRDPVVYGADTVATKPVLPADSVWIWAVLSELDEALGFQVFQPSSKEDALVLLDVHETWVGVGLGGASPRDQLCSNRPDGRGFFSDLWWDTNWYPAGTLVEACDLVRGSMSLHPSVLEFDRPGTLLHEAFHVLGKGHTCRWPSVVWARASCAEGEEGVNLTYPSEIDVAWTRISIEVRETQRRESSYFGIPETWEAEVIGDVCRSECLFDTPATGIGSPH